MKAKKKLLDLFQREPNQDRYSYQKNLLKELLQNNQMKMKRHLKMKINQYLPKRLIMICPQTVLQIRKKLQQRKTRLHYKALQERTLTDHNSQILNLLQIMTGVKKQVLKNKQIILKKIMKMVQTIQWMSLKNKKYQAEKSRK